MRDPYAIPRRWPGSTIVCLGTGPSLTAEDVAFVQGKAPVIAVNDAYRLAPWADVLYACDAKWWDVHQGVPSVAGMKLTLEARAEQWPGVRGLARTGDRGIETDPTGVRTGQNSGYQAMNVAVHLGARRILLLGYDMAPSAEGRSHWFGDHPLRLRRPSPYALFRDRFASAVEPLAALGVEVINCSRQTALTCFPRQSLAEALCSVAA